MLKIDNFLSFSIVNGFFIGLIISIIKFQSPEMIAIFTFFVTICFYLIFMVASAFYIRFFSTGSSTINKKKHDEIIEYFSKEFDKREKMTDKVREFMRHLENNRDEDDIPLPVKGR